MSILWAPEAELDRLHIWTHVAAENPAAARQLDRLFAKAAASLADFSQRGKPGRIPGTRELFPHENYRLVYEVHGETVWILALVHAARQWPLPAPAGHD